MNLYSEPIGCLIGSFGPIMELSQKIEHCHFVKNFTPVVEYYRKFNPTLLPWATVVFQMSQNIHNLSFCSKIIEHRYFLQNFTQVVIEFKNQNSKRPFSIGLCVRQPHVIYYTSRWFTAASQGLLTGRRQKYPPRVVENSTQAFGKSHLGFWKSARTQLGFSYRNL